MRATPMKLSGLAVVALAGCGGNGNGGPPDAAGIPPPPMLGAQIDRAGRPAISTLLIGTFATEPTRTQVKDAYRQASDPATWTTTMLRPNVSIERELETNLAAFDALDTGMTSVDMAGCRNALRYLPPTGAMSYQVAADMLADDELHLDTSLPTCEVFLALELEYGTGGAFAHTTCGGRMPSHDAIDMMYSMLAAGANAVVPQNDNGVTILAPLIHDGAPVHGDLTDTFPFLGPPHGPPH